DGIRDATVTGVQTCALPILRAAGKGLLLQSMGSAGGTGCSTVRLPSISKLPTVLPADVTRFATGTPIRSSSREAVMINNRRGAALATTGQSFWEFVLIAMGSP